jgi:hypothetical protein
VTSQVTGKFNLSSESIVLLNKYATLVAITPLSHPPAEDFSDGECRLSLETIVSALVVVLAHIIFNPAEGSSVPDLGVSRHMLQILQELSNISKDDGLIAVQNLCVELYRRAERALQGENSMRR